MKCVNNCGVTRHRNKSVSPTLPIDPLTVPPVGTRNGVMMVAVSPTMMLPQFLLTNVTHKYFLLDLN